MSVALRGNLDDFGIADVFQLIGQQRKTGVLEFTREGERVQIVFDRGSVVSAAPAGDRPSEALGELLTRCGLLTRARVEELHQACRASAESLPRAAVARGLISARDAASMQELLTRETIFSILRWSEGSFDFSAQEGEGDRPAGPQLGAEQILMDGLRMVDEWQNFAELVPSEDLVFQRVASFERYRAAAPRQSSAQLERAERVYLLIDGRLTVRRIIDLSRLGTFDAMQILAELRRAGVLEPLSAEAVRQLRRRRAAGPSRRAQLRGWLAVALPLVLLGAAVAGQGSAPPAASAGWFPIAREPLVALRDAYAARRVRHALEIYRLSQGGWPFGLAALGEVGILPELALAAGEHPAYYYERRGDGPVLLAPER